MEYKPIASGKVREIYDAKDALILVATDRISAFDKILEQKIEGKGRVLTQMSAFWFDYTKDVVKNHLITINNEEMPEFFRSEEFQGRASMVKKLKMIPIECIVRGYLAGSGFESYKKSGEVCGIKLPTGLKEADQLPEPIFTPSTKAEIGEHDQNVSEKEAAEYIEKTFPGKGEELAKKISELSITIYKKCAEYAKKRGIIIADTKFEFGVDEQGEVILADEVLTPDSSRFWPLDAYEPGKSQPSFDKQKVRDFIKKHNSFDLPKEVVADTAATYQKALELLTK